MQNQTLIQTATADAKCQCRCWTGCYALINGLLFFTCITISGLLMSTGCGRPSLASGKIANAEAGVEQARDLCQAKSYEQAKPILDQAIASGGLNADLLWEAYLLRARCAIADGDATAAQNDLEKAEQGSPPAAELNSVRRLIEQLNQGKLKATSSGAGRRGAIQSSEPSR